MRLKLALILVAFHATSATLAQTDKDKVGFTQLQIEVGASLEDGAGIRVGTVEAPNGSGNYLPDPSNSEFSGKTFTDGSGVNAGNNSHATSVGRRQYGNSSSLAPGVTDITGYDANDWINRVLGFDTSAAAGNQRDVPLAQDFSVMNHSYIGNGDPVPIAEEINRRLDLVADRDNVTMIVAANNGSASPIPQLFSPSYNSITVGLTDGGHSHGLTTINGSGRVKPDIVAPHGTTTSNSYTSFSTPFVASAATLLRDQGASAPSANATRNEVTKAVLLAGATKDEFPGWSHTQMQPLDQTFGAGELNIYNSYHIMAGGEFDGATTVGSAPDIGGMGWDYLANISADESFFYNFSVTETSTELSAILTWNAEISDSGGVLDYDTLELANLDLQLFNSSGGILGSLVDQSISSVDNVEHIFLTDLAIGEYSLAVNSAAGSISTDYAVAWRISAVPEPSAFFILTATCLLPLQRRKRLATHTS